MRRTATLAAALVGGASLASAFTYTVGVGKSEVTGEPAYAGFDPSRIVTAGSTTSNEINFQFLGGTHRVVQVSPDQPCAYAGGFDSGLQRVAAGTLQGSGPSSAYQITNNSAVLYFADIGEDYSPCYLGAVFCVNSDETSDTACHAVIDAAKALGVQYGVTTAPGASSTASSSASSSAASASASSSASSASSSASSRSATSSGSSASSSSASRTASGSAAAASQSGSSSGAAALKITAGAMALVGGAVALMA